MLHTIYMKQILRNNLLPIFIIVIVGLIGTLSFFHQGFFTSHDGEWMVIRLSDFHRSLMDGQIPVRWAGRLNYGYGYPVFNFLYPGTFYFTEIFHLIRLNFVDSVKASFVATYFLSGIFMYLFLRKIFGKWPAVVGSVLYIFSPYRFVDLYVRGSLGESVAFMFPPLFLFCFTGISKYKNLAIPLCIVALAGLITTHNVIAYLFLPILFIFSVLYAIKSHEYTLKNIILVYVGGILLSAFFWLPALFEKQYTIFDKVVVADYKENFPSLLKLVLPSWNYGPSKPTDPFSMSFQIGVVNLFVLIVATIYLLNMFIGKKIKENWFGTFSLITALLSIFTITSASNFIWNIIPGLSLIQFPWRILSVIVFATATLSAFLLHKANSKYLPLLSVVIICLVVFFNINYLRPQEFVNREEGFYSTNDDTTTVQREYMPIKSRSLQQKRAEQKIELIKGKAEISARTNKSNKLEFMVKADDNFELRVNTVFFPGWEMKINSKNTEIVTDKQGLIVLNLPKGEYLIVLEFKETLLRKISDLISVITLIIITLIAILKWQKK